MVLRFYSRIFQIFARKFLTDDYSILLGYQMLKLCIKGLIFSIFERTLSVKWPKFFN